MTSPNSFVQITSNRETNVFQSYLASQVSGRKIRNIQGTSAFTKRLDKEYFGIPSLINDLKEAIVSNHYHLVKTTLCSISNKICDMGEETEELFPQKEAFDLFGGTAVIMDLIRSCLSRLDKVSTTSSSYTTIVNTLNESLAILRDLCFSLPNVCNFLSNDNTLLVDLFGITKHKGLFESAVGILEELLAAKDIFDLSLVPDIGKLIMGLSARKLAFFCRLLALVIFQDEQAGVDHAKVLKSYDLLRVRVAHRNKGVKKVIEANQVILLEIPGFLDRLVKLIYIQSVPTRLYTEQLMMQFNSSIELLSLLVALEDPDNDWDIPLDTAVSSNPESLSLKALTLATHQVEILFVICTLLGGVRKESVQEQLYNLNLIPKLVEFYPKINWFPVEDESKKIHGPKCECNPESALKIQYVRLISNFCDVEKTDKLKMGLLSSEEKELISWIHSQKDSRGVLSQMAMKRVEDYLAKSADSERSGLIFKMANIFLKLPITSTFRFWLASTIESFMRKSDPVHQFFIAKSGMLKSIVNEIIKNGAAAYGHLQTSFDLLAELMKFNPEVFVLFNSFVSEDQFDKLSDIIMNSLVDSNMFLRATLLSIEYFRADTSSAPYNFAECKIARFLEKLHEKILAELFTAVTIQDIAPENICCLNTGLVFLIFEKRKGNLKQALTSMREVYATRHPQDQYFALNNAKQLLLFWREYYDSSDKDCISLEFSTRTKITEWHETVELTLQELSKHLQRKVEESL